MTEPHPKSLSERNEVISGELRDGEFEAANEHIRNCKSCGTRLKGVNLRLSERFTERLDGLAYIGPHIENHGPIAAKESRHIFERILTDLTRNSTYPISEPASKPSNYPFPLHSESPCFRAGSTDRCPR